MLMQELGRIIQEDPNLCAMAMADKRKYIISKWNASHSEPIDEDAVALFLCDENRGNLTDEQRAFAKERCAEFEFCNQVTAFRLFQCGEMMRQHLVNDACPARRNPSGFSSRSAPSPAAEESPFAAACEALCALLAGRVESLPHRGIWSGFGPISGQALGRRPRRDEEQEKALALLWRLGGHFRPQCGRFQGAKLALFRPTQFEIDAVFSQKPPESPR